VTKRHRRRTEGPARPIKTKRDFQRATTIAKRLSGQKSLDSTAELRLQSLLKELDKFDSPEEESGEDDPGQDYAGPRRRWSDDASGGE